MKQQNTAVRTHANEMIDHYFIEGVYYSRKDLQHGRLRVTTDSRDAQVAASNSPTEIDAVIQALCEYQFTTAGSKSHTSALEFHPDQSEPYTFQFVGVLVVHDYVFYVFPKFVKPTHDSDSKDSDPKIIEPSPAARAFMRQIIDVCNHYRKRNVSGTDDTGISTHTTTNNVNIAELYRALLADYVRDGVYRTTMRVWEHNGNGNIDWERTLNRVDPYFTQQGAPIYADYWTRGRAVDEEALVRRIQLAWVAHVAQQFDASGLLVDVLGFPCALCAVSRELPTDIGTTSFLRAALIRARNREFSTRNRTLINMLLLLVDTNEQQRLDSQHAVTHLGTAPFHTVWEDICSELFSNTELDEVREKSKPLWRMQTGTDNAYAEITANNQLIPDVIHTMKNPTGEPGGMVIIDAKYYTPEHDAQSISGQPGTYDVVKEYFYQLIADIALQSHGRVLANAFMFPAPIVIENGDDPMPCTIQGSVRIDALGRYMLQQIDGNDSERTLLPIVYAQLNPKAAFRAYIDSHDREHFDSSAILSELIRYSQN